MIGRRRVPLVAWATAALLIALALPAGAAATRTYHQPAQVIPELQLRGTNGFHFLASSFGGSQFISASRRASKLGVEHVSYLDRAHGPALRHGILRIKIGRLGTFRGRFLARRTKTQKLPRDCTGEPTITEAGVFVGSFNLRGERGYSTVHAHSAHGTVTRQGATTCKVPTLPGREEGGAGKEEGKGGGESKLLAADRHFHTSFQASREEEAGETFAATFIASSTEKSGGLVISRDALLFDVDLSGKTDPAAAAFQIPNLAEPLAEAKIEPPEPFTGSATFALTSPTTANWTGDLAVELPGVGKVPLTGGAIKAGLCAPWPYCTKTLPEPAQDVLEAPPGVVVEIGSKTKGDSPADAPELQTIR